MSLNVKRFVAKLNETDMARSNLYIVKFPSMANYLNNDGVIDNAFIDDTITSLNGSAGKLYSSAKKTISRGLDAYDSFETLAGLLGGDYTSEYDMGLMVKNVNLPGSTLEVDIDKSRRNPYPIVKSKTDSTVTMTFYLTEDHAERRAMMAWYKSIYNTQTASVAFYKTYVKNIEIMTYSRKAKMSTVTNLKNAFPTRIGDVTLGYENNNEISTFEVEFVYESFTYSDNTFLKEETDQIESVLSAGGSAFNNISSFF